MESSPPASPGDTHAEPGNRPARIPTWVLALIVPVIAALAVGTTVLVTGDDSDGAAAASTKPGTITIKDFTFSPDPIEVKAGTPVTITNADGTTHTLTAKGKAFDAGDIAGGATTTITVDAPGTYAYFCEIHQYMTGTLKAS